MIGRKNDLEQLESLYLSPNFEFLTMYGRRRIGKTTILKEFSRQHKTIFFSAQEKMIPLIFLIFPKHYRPILKVTLSHLFQHGKMHFPISRKKGLRRNWY